MRAHELTTGRTFGVTFDHSEDFFDALSVFCRDHGVRQGYIPSFVVLPRRWVVERSFSWLIRARRLARDYETRIDSAEAMAWWAASIPATRRLARSGASAPRRLKRSAA